jgi:hypothetical protein
VHLRFVMVLNKSNWSTGPIYHYRHTVFIFSATTISLLAKLSNPGPAGCCGRYSCDRHLLTRAA